MITEDRDKYLNRISEVVKSVGGFLRLKNPIYPEGKTKKSTFLVDGMYVSEILDNQDISYYFKGFKKKKLNELSDKEIYCIFESIEKNEYSGFSISKLKNKVREEAGHIKLTKNLVYEELEYDLVEMSLKTISYRRLGSGFTTTNDITNVSDPFLEEVYKLVLRGNYL